MSALGDLPRVRLAIHSDTGHEMESTYKYAAEMYDWLYDRGIGVLTVKNDDMRGTDILVQNKNTTSVQVPAFTVNDNGKKGVIQRQCTKAWKIAPMRRWIRENLPDRVTELWLGISTDEFTRAKDSDVEYIKHRYPLLELGMSRQDCVNWLQDHHLPVPEKSSCTFCPYHTKRDWEKIRARGGADWEDAVFHDRLIRDAMLPGQLFVHSSGLPLEEAVRGPEYDEPDPDDVECDSGFCFM
jgi:hypothetical protein